jgi:hypothetical protein
MKEFKEEFKVKGEDLLRKVKEIIHQGNIRRIVIKNTEGKSIVEFPLTFGVVGAVLAPVLAAVGAIAALASDYTIEVYKTDEKDAKQDN